ncbi:MAG: VaFE repeat-containing surface-anchored protein, partial [Clostridia bacterium]|nr:VaFE repeat-containing surface-anchored protein [Clostridia bacterium]
ENIDDEAQTVHFPDGRTNASDPDTNDRTMKAEQDVKIRDEFVYENLIPGKQYVITGKAMLKPVEGEEPQEITAVMVDADGNEITEYVFTPESKDGSESVYFVIDATELAGRSVVMYETMEYINPELEIRAEIVKHEDINDEDETIHFPDGGTKATDSETLDHIARPDEKAKFIDEVTYRNLIPGKMYTVKGILMDKDTGEPVIADGSEVTAEMQFVPEEADGSVFMEFEFNASALAGATSVVFETVYSEGKEVFAHADIDDEEQTIHFPDGGTTALDSETGSHTSYADEDITIIDEVTYRNLVPGKEYTVTGTLKDKETGKSLKAGGKEVTSEKTFTAETADGSVFIEFTFNGVRLAGRSIVAFETMTLQGVPVFVHADLEDRDQTVDFPEVHTTATDKKDGDHEIDYKGTVTVKDDVEYTNLTPGMKYRVAGTLMNKKTGKAAKAGGREITGEAEFTAKEKNGTVQVEFTFDSSKLEEGSYVVFETLYEIDAETGEEHIVGAHRDINDDAQTVRRPKPPTPHRVRTGDDSNMAVWAIALTAAIAGLAGAVIYRKRFGK